jgi:serine/threonine-protein kinase
VLRAEIDLSDLPGSVPRSVRHLLQRCLERDPTRRLRDIGEARIALDDAIDRPEATDEPAAPAPAMKSGSRTRWIVAGLAIVIAAAALAWVSLREQAAPMPTHRFTITMPNSGNSRQGDGAAITISPDGKHIVTRGGAGTDDILYMRVLDEFEPTPIAGTAGARVPMFSPDGAWIAYISPRGLHKIRTAGGATINLGWMPAVPAGYDWADDGFLYYSAEGQIWRIPEEGGDPEQLTEIELAESQGLEEPHAVTEVGVVLCSSTSGPGQSGSLYGLDLKTRKLTELDMPGGDPYYLQTGHLLFHQAGRIVVAGFDIDTMAFTGTPVPVLERAWVDDTRMQLDVSANGTVAYLPRRPGETQSLVFVDHDGKVEPALPSGLPFSSLNDPRISPDGNRLVVSADSNSLWVIDLLTQTSTLMSESGFYPLWSPDGSEIIFSTTRNKTYDVYQVPIDLSRPESLLLDAEHNMRTMDWTAQDVIVLREELPKKGMDLRYWTDRSDESTVTNLLDGPDDELAPVVSPDGKWMAYVSDYSGSDEIYVTSFPTAGGRSKISNKGGSSPTWSPDGKTLYYLEGFQMIAVALETEPAFRVLGREGLFEGEYVQYRWSRQYDIMPDGKRFVMIKNPPRGDIEVITNWFEELRGLED